mmetsp:Transcript_46966/g.144663  ORF Transcript_46966/g.144663 Transcript_46966/m.144663 type:complete len:394 (-) Transcript_46966:100-1281(-)
MDLGVCAVALPHADTEFGKKYLEMIDAIQELWKECMPSACKNQTTPHMSIGSVVLDKPTPHEYNNVILSRLGLMRKVEDLTESLNPPARARIQTLKINPDGCVTFQLEHDPSQDVTMSEADLEAALRKVPTCRSDEAMQGEKRKFKKEKDGTHTVSRFQQIRLALGALGCEIKGMYPSGHMVVVNLVDPKAMAEVPQEKLEALFTSCHETFTPLKGQWFELKRIVCLSYVERSLNEGSVVLAPLPGQLPKAFPEGSEAAEALLGGIFTATVTGDVLIDLASFEARRNDRGKGEWQSFYGEVRQSAEHQGDGHKTGDKPNATNAFRNSEAEHRAMFEVFDKDGSGFISRQELGQVMEKLGEPCTEAELTEMMESADIDHSGQISYEEFRKLTAK